MSPNDASRAELPDQRTQLPVQARVDPHELAVQHGEDRGLRIDAEGRWASLRDGPRFWRRLVDGGVVLQPEPRGAPRDLDDGAAVHERARAVARQLHEAILGGRVALELHGPEPSPDRLIATLARVDAWPAERFLSERRRFEAAYPEPPQIVPPDRYKDLLVLPSLGCPNRACTFCAWYRDREFRILEPDEFAAHVDALSGLFGAALGARSGIFLGSANALAIPQPRLLDVMRALELRVGGLKRGFAAFWDPHHTPRRAPSAWRALVAAGMQRVFAGLETADPALRASIGKPGDLARFGADLTVAKEAGVSIGVTLLIGVGGEAACNEHFARSVDYLAGLPLTTDDIVYLSPLAGGLPAERSDEELMRFRDAVRGVTGAKVAPYRIEGYRYYA